MMTLTAWVNMFAGFGYWLTHVVPKKRARELVKRLLVLINVIAESESSQLRDVLAALRTRCGKKVPPSVG